MKLIKEDEMKINSRLIGGYSDPNCCFTNVERIVKSKGGRAVYGWLDSGRPGDPLRELVHHCIWEDPDGELWDITPQYAVMGSNLFTLGEGDFLPDPDATFEGVSRPKQITAIEPKFTWVAECMTRSESRAMQGDMDGANYWTDRANAQLDKIYKSRTRGFGRFKKFDRETFEQCISYTEGF